jgi:protein-disulfide isomerase
MFGIPLAIWGAIFFGSMALLGVGGVIFWRDSGRVFLRWAFWLAVFGLAFDLYLGYTMIFQIKAVCWLCIATYAINFIITLFLVKGVLKEPRPRISLRTIFPGTKDAQGIDLYYRNVIKGLLIGGILLAAVAGVAGSQFLSKALTEDDREYLAKIKKNLAQQKPKVIEVKNRPVLGSEDAAVTVVEFSDFLCPYCAKASRYIKLAESGTHDTVRFVFRHYPLDKSCNRKLRSDVHPGACMLAEGAVCASEQNKFWEYHDIAFEAKGRISRSVVMDNASKIGLALGEFKSCLDSGRGLKVVREDIEAAFNAGVKSTPTLFINGRRLRGVPKSWMLNEILQYSQKHLAPPK